MKKIFKIIFVILAVVYVAFGAALFASQKEIIYRPDRQDFTACANFADSEKLNLNGTRAYYKKNSGDLVVFYHGNAGSACDMAFLKDIFEKNGLSYIFVEYAGYSSDERKPSKTLLMKDAENVNEFIKNGDFAEITVMGHSLGAALAVYHSSMANIDKLLLVAPFCSMADLAQRDYYFYPVRSMLTENYDSGSLIAASRAKSIEIIHGTDDESIPFEQSEKLFSKIKNNDKRLIKVARAHHNDIWNFPEARTGMDNFFKE
ncbi:MAG: alpha/beta hydrolase [Candidatus Pacebacteria bacterium]|jgi:hypothetical protein|nr:alpha/beta hydrolase [Candidatus Paceibacterota bacterium]